MLRSKLVNFKNFQRVSHLLNHQQIRLRSGLPVNTCVLFVPQQEAWVVERFGKFLKVLDPGLNILIPVVDTIKYVQSLKEIAIDIPHQAAITVDNVTLQIDGVLYLRITDPYKASYGVEDPEYAITQLAQTLMRAEIGKIHLDTVFREREGLNLSIVEAINKASHVWGIDCLRYEIRDIKLPNRVQEAMQMQVEAERKKRAAILESEGIREANINVAQGKREAQILASEGLMQEQINDAKGQAEAIIRNAKARAETIETVARAIAEQNGPQAVAMHVAEQYIKAFGNVAKTGNTVLLPANTGDATSMVAQAMSIYNSLAVTADKQGNSGMNKPLPSTTDVNVKVGTSESSSKHGAGSTELKSNHQEGGVRRKSNSSEES